MSCCRRAFNSVVSSVKWLFDMKIKKISQITYLGFSWSDHHRTSPPNSLLWWRPNLTTKYAHHEPENPIYISQIQFQYPKCHKCPKSHAQSIPNSHKPYSQLIKPIDPSSTNHHTTNPSSPSDESIPWPSCQKYTKAQQVHKHLNESLPKWKKSPERQLDQLHYSSPTRKWNLPVSLCERGSGGVGRREVPMRFFEKLREVREEPASAR